MDEDVKIVMFCCNWCSYGGADTAGTARIIPTEYKSNSSNVFRKNRPTIYP